MFTDRLHLLIQAGHGGNGCDSCYHRLDRKIIYNGGDGGAGGSVIFRAEQNAPPISTLKFRQHIVAQCGGNGGSFKKRGRTAEDLVVIVPVGVKIFDRRNQMLIRELKEHGESVVVARGGKGGVGNIGHKQAQPGERGEEVEIELLSRLHSDAFMIGLPCSGKSSLLNHLTRTHAKHENHPFKTKDPEIGVLKFSDYEQMTLCELPSLYEGSHEGRGCGTDFLKHLEGAKWILWVIDQDSQFAASLKDGYKILKNELDRYDAGYLRINHAVIVTKMDLPESREKLKKAKFKPSVPVFPISVISGEGIQELKQFLYKEIYSTLG